MGRITIFCFALIAFTTVARADDRAVAREHFEKGTKAFNLGAYDEAIEEYSAAYRAVDDPALLYNIAQAHRLAGHASEALRFYKMYLVRAPQATNGAEVEAKIAELEKLVEQQQKTKSMPPDMVKPPSGANGATAQSPTPATPPAATPPAATPPAAKVTPAPAPAIASARSDAARTKKIVGLTVGGVGVAALVTGIALSAVAKQYSDDLSNSTGVWDKAKHDTGQTLGVAGPVLIAVGGAATVAGAVVAALGFRESRLARRTSLAVIPQAGPRGAGATVRIRF